MEGRGTVIADGIALRPAESLGRTASSAALTTTVPVEPPTGPYADIEVPSMAGSSP